MLELEFSSKEIKFQYESKKHLNSTITVTNTTNIVAYFKFKLTRPKYYLLKPDKGFLQPKQTISIDITLHKKKGVNDAEQDKVKCFYKFVGKTHNEPSSGWEKDELETYNVRMLIEIKGLPEELRKEGDQMKYSQVKSLARSKFDSNNGPSNILQSSIKEKENKVSNLYNQIDSLRSGQRSRIESFSWEYIAAAVGGLVIGLISSVWI